MSFGAVAAIGGAVIGGTIAANGAKSAAKTQARSADAATAAEREMFDITREDQAPYRALATEVGLPGLRNILGQNQQLTSAQVMAEPGYQFGLNQGLGAIDKSASARGGLYSGATLKALSRYGNDYASTKFNDAFNRMETSTNNRFNRFATAAGIGQAATNQVNAQGAQLGQSIGNNLIGAGNTSAASAIGQSNVWSNALNRATGYGTNWFNSPSSAGSSISNGSLFSANMSSDPIGSLAGSQGW